VVSSRHSALVEQGALTAAGLGALYAIWLGLGLPAVPIPFPGNGGTEGASRGALIVNQLPDGATRAAATFAPATRTHAANVPRRVRPARASRTGTRGAVRTVSPPPAVSPLPAPAPAQSREPTSTAQAPTLSLQPVDAAPAAVTPESAPPTVTQPDPVPPPPAVPSVPADTVPSIPAPTLPPAPSLPAVPQPDLLSQTPSPPAGLPELPSPPG